MAKAISAQEDVHCMDCREETLHEVEVAVEETATADINSDHRPYSRASRPLVRCVECGTESVRTLGQPG